MTRAPASPPPSSTHDPRDARRGGSALVVIDMISRWDYPDAAPVLRQALAIAPAVQRLAARCRARGVPVIHADDNRGRWRSDQRALVRAALADRADGSPGAMLTRSLAPQDDDYFVLKPCHSAFFATPLEMLLRDLGAERVVLAGVSADQCVLATALDARMRRLEIVVPRDAVAAPTPARTRAALRHFAEVLAAPTPLASRVRL